MADMPPQNPLAIVEQRDQVQYMGPNYDADTQTLHVSPSEKLDVESNLAQSEAHKTTESFAPGMPASAKTVVDPIEAAFTHSFLKAKTQKEAVFQHQYRERAKLLDEYIHKILGVNYNHDQWVKILTSQPDLAALVQQYISSGNKTVFAEIYSDIYKSFLFPETMYYTAKAVHGGDLTREQWERIASNPEIANNIEAYYTNPDKHGISMNDALWDTFGIQKPVEPSSIQDADSLLKAAQQILLSTRADLAEIISKPEAKLYLLSNPRRASFLAKSISTQQIGGVIRFAEDVVADRGVVKVGDDALDMVDSDYEHIHQIITPKSMYVALEKYSARGSQFTPEQVAEALNLPDIQKDLPNAYKGSFPFIEFLGKLGAKIGVSLKTFSELQSSDVPLNSKALNQILKGTGPQGDMALSKLIENSTGPLISAAKSNSNVRKTLNKRIRDLYGVYGKRKRSDEDQTPIQELPLMLTTLVNEGVLDEDTIDSMVQNSGGHLYRNIPAYTYLMEALLTRPVISGTTSEETQASNDKRWAQFNHILYGKHAAIQRDTHGKWLPTGKPTRNDSRINALSFVAKQMYQKSGLIPKEEVDSLLLLVTTPEANPQTKITARDTTAKAMGLFSNAIVSPRRVTALLDDIQNNSFYQDHPEYSFFERANAQCFLRQVSGTDTKDETALRDKALKNLLVSHIGDRATPQLLQNMDTKIDNTDPDAVKELAKRVLGLGFGLNLFRTLGRSEAQSDIFSGRGVDLPAAIVDSNFGGNMNNVSSDDSDKSGDLETDRTTGNSSMYFSPALESASLYQKIKGNGMGGSVVLTANIPIQNLIEVRYLLGLESFKEYNKRYGINNEDPWIRSMRNADPPKTMREALERIFSLYTAREVQTLLPTKGNSFMGGLYIPQASERGKQVPDSIRKEPMSNQSKIHMGHQNMGWYRIAQQKGRY